MPEKGAPPNVHPVQRRVLRALSALSTPLLPDDYLEMINPLWSTRELRGPDRGGQARDRPTPRRC